MVCTQVNLLVANGSVEDCGLVVRPGAVERLLGVDDIALELTVERLPRHDCLNRLLQVRVHPSHCAGLDPDDLLGKLKVLFL